MFTMILLIEVNNKTDVIVGTAVVGTLLVEDYCWSSSAIEAIIQVVVFLIILIILEQIQKEKAHRNKTDYPTTKKVINFENCCFCSWWRIKLIGFKDASTAVQIFRAIDIGTSTAGT
jgi:hypothetical protein